MDINSSTRVLVTGGASGIGLATVAAFLEKGARVAVNHLPGDTAALEAIARLNREHGGHRVLAAPGDVSDKASAEGMVAQGVADLGGLDVLVNNAGTSGTREPIPMGDLERLTDEFWARILNTNLMGPFWCARAAAPHMSDGGAILNTASVAGMGGGGSSMVYAASKAALVNMTLNMARGLGPRIRVNAVAPGMTRTPWTDSWPEDQTIRILDTTVLKRWVEAEDIAQAMVFLAQNRGMTGQTLIVDGGKVV